MERNRKRILWWIRGKIWGRIYKWGKNGIIFEYNYNSNCNNKTDGIYINGLKQGFVKVYNDDEKLTYNGEYVNNEKNRYGKIYKSEKLIFEGQFVKGKRNGK